MSGRRQFTKAIEKFQKSAEKELIRLAEVEETYASLAETVEKIPALSHFADRLSQKRAHLDDDVAWSNDFIERLKALFDKDREKERSDKKPKAKVSKDKRLKKSEPEPMPLPTTTND